MNRRTLKGIGEVMVQRRPIEWLWEPYLPRCCVTTLGAKGGTGKSAFALWLASMLARGKGYKTLYVDLEQSLAHISERADKWDLSTLNEFIFIPTEEDPVVGIESASPTFADILKDAQDVKADLIVIDSLTSLYNHYDVEKRQGASFLMKELRAIAVRTNTALMLLAHTNKARVDNAAQFSVDNITGSAAISDLSRSVIYLSEDDADPDSRILTHLKCNYRQLADPACITMKADGMDIASLKKNYPHIPSGSKIAGYVRLANDFINQNVGGAVTKRDIRRVVTEAGGSSTEASRVCDKLADSGVAFIE